MCRGYEQNLRIGRHAVPSRDKGRQHGRKRRYRVVKRQQLQTKQALVHRQVGALVA
jgi:hypothetical protein